MRVGSEEQLLGDLLGIIENWDNLNQWGLNPYTQETIYPAQGSAAVASNRVEVSSYGTGNGGPLIAYPLVGDAESFTLTANIRFTTGTDGGICYVGFVDENDPTDERLYLFLGNTSVNANTCSLRLVSEVGGSLSVEESQNSPAVAAEYEIDFTLTKDGTSVTYTISGDFTASGSFTHSGPLNSLFIDMVRRSGASITQSVGPLELEYTV